MIGSRRNDSPASDDATARDLFAWSLLAGLLLLITLAGPFFAGRVYTFDDLGAFHLPARAFYAQQLAQGEAFDWMPSLYSGLYLTGEGQVGTYHPLHLLLYRLLPLRAAVAWEWLVSYPLMLAGMFLLLRRKLDRRDAAMFGALLFTFSSFNLLHFVHPNAVAVVAHVPWLLWTLDIMLLDSRRRRVTLAQTGYALLTGSQLLIGYPQYVWFSLLTEAAFVTFIVARHRYDPLAGCATCARCDDCIGCEHTPWARLAIAKLCGVLIGWVQVLPTIDALTHSARRGADVAFAESGSLHPLNLLQLVAPYMLTDRVTGSNTHELGLYAGAVPLVLIVWVIAHRRWLGQRAPLAVAAGGFGIFALLMATGRYAGLYRLQAWLPVIGSFRFPCRYLVLFQLAVAVVAAIGLTLLVREYLETRSKRRRQSTALMPPLRLHAWWEQYRVLWLIVSIATVVALIGLPFAGGRNVAAWPQVVVGPLLIGAAALLVALAARGHRWALIALILYAGFDLGVYGMTYGVYARTERIETYLARVDPPPHRRSKVVVVPRRFNEPGLRTGNEVTLTGARRADGYVGLEPAVRVPLDSLAALRVAGVDFVRNCTATRQIDGLVEHDEKWLRVPGPLPRARLVAETHASDRPARALGRVDVERVAVVDTPIDLPGGEPGETSLLADRPGYLRLSVQCSARQLLAISERFDPGWRAVVDGEPRPVLRVNGDYLGCIVGPGQQIVELEFRPVSLRLGRMVSLLGLAVTAVCYFAYGWPPRSYAWEKKV